jgi:hypothetical protein
MAIFNQKSVVNLVNDLAKIYDGKEIKLINDMVVGDKIYDADTMVNLGMFTREQLTQVLPQILEQVLPEFIYSKLGLAIDNQGKYLESMILRGESIQGRPRNINQISTDAGIITINRTGTPIQPQMYGMVSDYRQYDFERGMMLNENIDTSLLKAHKKSYDQFIEQSVFQGIVDVNGDLINTGLANYDGYNSNLRLDSDSTFATYLASGDGMGIYNQISKLINEMASEGNGAMVFDPTLAILPPKQKKILDTLLAKDTSAATGYSSISKLLEKNLNLKVLATPLTIGMGDGASDRLILLNPMNDNMKLYIPMPLEFAPLDIRGFRYTIESQFKIAGVFIARNNAIGYLDHI